MARQAWSLTGELDIISTRVGAGPEPPGESGRTCRRGLA